MKLKKEFVVHHAGEKSLLVPAGGAEFSGLISGNRTFGEVLELLRKDTSEAAVTAALRARYPGAGPEIEEDVHTALEKLRGVHALED